MKYSLNLLWNSAPSAYIRYIVTLSLLVWVVVHGAESNGYTWQWHRVIRFIGTFETNRFIPGPLLQGTVVTLRISVWGFLGATFIAFSTALLRLSGSLVGRIIARIYLEMIRNTPLLVQLFIIYFIIAPTISMDRMSAAILALSLFEGAYASEIIRAGILSIPSGQWEAALSLGMSRKDIYLKIILPQALKNVLPPLVSQSISLIKDSALVSTIAIYDLTMHAQAIVSDTFLTFEVWFTVAAIYLVLTSSLSLCATLLANKNATRKS